MHYPISKNQFILVNSNEIHSIEAPRENFTIVIQIPQETFEAYREEEYILFKSTRYEEDSELIGLIRNMYRVYAEKKYGYELEVKSFFYKLLHILIIKYKEKDIDKERIRQNTARKVVPLQNISRNVIERILH